MASTIPTSFLQNRRTAQFKTQWTLFPPRSTNSNNFPSTNVISPTNEQQDSAIDAFDDVLDLPAIKPRLFTGFVSDSSALDVLVGESYPVGLQAADYTTFGRVVNRKVGTLVDGNNRELIFGTGWLQGVRNIGGILATLRITFNKPENNMMLDKQKALIDELSQGFTITVGDQEIPINVGPSPPEVFFDCCIVRVSNLHPKHLKAGMGEIVYSKVLKKLEGLNDSEFQFEFMLPNTDWGYDKPVYDTRSVYIALKNVHNQALVNRYIPFRLSAMDVCNVSQLPPNYVETLGQLSADIKSKKWDTLPEIILLPDESLNNNPTGTAMEGLVQVGGQLVLPNSSAQRTMTTTDQTNKQNNSETIEIEMGDTDASIPVPVTLAKQPVKQSAKKSKTTQKITLKSSSKNKIEVKLPLIETEIEQLLVRKVKPKFQVIRGKDQKLWKQFLDRGQWNQAACGMTQESAFFHTINSLTGDANFAFSCGLDENLNDISSSYDNNQGNNSGQQ